MATMTVLIGAPGAGKTTYTQMTSMGQVLSLDALRGEVSGVECNQAATAQAVELLHEQVQDLLLSGIDIVIDATNAEHEHRASLLTIADHTIAAATAIIVDTPLQLCLERNAARPEPTSEQTWGRRVPQALLAELHAKVSALTDRQLHDEGFLHVRRIETL